MEGHVVCVTGMHRSGTSLVAGLLRALGLELGPDDQLAAPASENPRGFNEHREITAINRAVLGQFGGSWDEPPLFPDGWEQDRRLNALRASALGAMRDLRRLAPVVGWKDPQTSLLLPFWRTVCPIAATVLVVRDPREVAASLATRNGLSGEQSAALWLRYTADAWRSDASATLVLHHDLFADPGTQIDLLAAIVGTPTSSGQRDAALRLVDPALRHQHGAEGMPTGENLDLACAVYELLGQRRNDDALVLLRALGADRRARVRAEREARDAAAALATREARIDQLNRDLEHERALAGTVAENARRDGARLEEGRRHAEEKLRALRQRRSVRAALRLARTVRPLRRALPRARARTGAHGARTAPPAQAPGPALLPAVSPPPAHAAEDGTAAAIERLMNRAPVTVIVPVFNAADELRRCLAALRRNTTAPAELLLIDDASTDRAVAPLLEEAATWHGVRVERNAENLGYVRTVNRGLELTAGDVVLLNSDSEVTPRWLEQLTQAAYSEDRVASVTAVSNNAGAFSVPERGVANAVPPGLTHDEVGRLVSAVSTRVRPHAPTGNGFCMYVRRAALRAVGHFDAERFPRGYGEENDWCMRAGAAGWVHLVDDATLVFHARSASFAGEKQALMAAGRAQVDAAHPTYTAAVRAFLVSEDLARVHASVRHAYASASTADLRPKVLYVLHEGSGGTPKTNLDLMRGLAARYRPFTLCSDTRALSLCELKEGELVQRGYWPLAERWQITDIERDDVRAITNRVLVEHGIELVHVRHLLGHTLDVATLAKALDIPLVISFHDFYLSCPTIQLLDDRREFCGGHCTPGEGACRVFTGWLSPPPLKHAWVHTWRRHVAPVLADADALVTTAVHTRQVYLDSFPRLSAESIDVIEHGRDLPQALNVAEPPSATGPVRVLVPGDIDDHKGGDLIRALMALDREGRFEWHFLGRLTRRYRDFPNQHGEYQREDFVRRAGDIRPSFIAVLSIWPETYSHTLTEAWAAGVPVFASDIGVLRERVLTHGGGWLLDHRDPARALEQMHLATDRGVWEQQRAAATLAGTRTVAQMAEDYDALYRRTFLRRRAFT